MAVQKALTPTPIATLTFTDAAAAVVRLEEIYERNTAFLRGRFETYTRGERLDARVRSTYPFVRITTDTYARLDSRLSYGFVSRPGMHQASVTRPDLFRAYFTEQIGLLVQNHGVSVEIGESDEPIPIHFAYRRDTSIEATVAVHERTMTDRPLRDLFDAPDLAAMDDTIVNGTLNLVPGSPARNASPR
jgi:AMP nucleosidase